MMYRVIRIMTESRTQSDACRLSMRHRQALAESAHLDRVPQRRARAVHTHKAHILRRQPSHLQ